MEVLFSWFKKSFSMDSQEESYSADEESFLFLKRIVSSMRENGSHLANGEVYLSHLTDKIEKYKNERDVKILLAKFHSTFKNLNTVISDKPFLTCRLTPENKQTIEQILALFETSLDFATRDADGFDIENHRISLDELLSDSHLKNKKK